MAIKDSTSEPVGIRLHTAAKDSGPEGGARQVDLASAAVDAPVDVPAASIDDALAGRLGSDPVDDGVDAPDFGGGTGGKAALADRVGSPFDDAAAQDDAGPAFGKDAISDVTSGATPFSPVAFTNSAGEVKSVGSAATGDGMFFGVDVGAMRFEKEATQAADDFDANQGTGTGSGGESTGSGSGTEEDSDDGAGDVIHEQDNEDGSHTSVYGDGTIITTHPDGTQETSYPDGTVETDNPDGTLVTEYPDGSTQTIHPDGTIEETPPTEDDGEGGDESGDDGEGEDPPPDGEGEGGDDTPDGGGDDTTGESSVESTPGDEDYDLPPDFFAADDLAGLARHRGGQHDAGTETQPVEGDLDFGSGTVSGPVPDLRTKLLGDPAGPDGLDGFGTGARPIGEVTPGNVDGNVDPGFDADPGVQTSGPEERDTTHDLKPEAGSDDGSGSSDDGSDGGSDGSDGSDDGGFVGIRHHDLREPADDVPDDLEDLSLDLF